MLEFEFYRNVIVFALFFRRHL